MIASLVSSERIKFRRTSLALVTLLIPVLTLFYEIMNFLFRSETLYRFAYEKKANLWVYFIFDKHFFLSLALPLGITLAASIIANTEHQAHAWKQICALPVSRIQLYFSKFLILMVTSLISATLLGIGMALFGVIFGFKGDIPWFMIFGDSYFPYFASIPIMGIQLWLSMVVHNQAFSISIGTVSTVVGLFLAIDPKTQWLPWAYPLASSTIRLNYQTQRFTENPDLFLVVLIGVILGAFLVMAGAFHFAKRDVQ